MSVREGLLALLSTEPAHGYQLKAGFEAATGGVWPLNIGQVYTTLDRLARDGFVVAGGGATENGRRPYAITETGRAELTGWLYATPDSAAPPPRDALLARVLVALHLPGTDAQGVIQSQRRSLVEALQHHRRSARPETASLPARLVSDAVAFRLEADLRWLDLCEERLSSAPPNEPTNGVNADTRRSPR